ncbi:similar to Saccharomyces cerevisiae YDR163W CWC15 Non-essential protein involved in pre-mRNA splicing, component of a complex containing Cef1p [Maudiozyma barnettii]|uniref:Similar to Saccharomyces cerevisiae YDR163W CWC15 Non-essential protein involved in pre-mRNA splicing, component of a complex containing Cef1p n=1 Tax=Maudiozyma barnettii TaxID=61262 RepID=A0A8H2ZHE3_9SACH|nr:U2-type spliceosomal complex subunit CWC15 [Kazachstania barnettii]CAB4255669.1 similar to Saccharomyces cerevisiae YDR163W CWC15 Non-essential protein involved in pre-mRNA splicing, component of a complex containing Cef1p [Kazachstania barnettii]CAD1784230.1 similar to Saccharomyces cerevisiae YDR163W CWC15 Non-essential protein involved in pre-mRNA splicing, component of a complex containing Cef1p [Kazachstania barnettii]
MSTSHRPQLEARSGAKAAGYSSTSIEHARLQPGHKSLKYRDHIRDSIQSSSNKESDSTITVTNSSLNPNENRGMDLDTEEVNRDKNSSKVKDNKKSLNQEFKHLKDAQVEGGNNSGNSQSKPKINKIKKGWRSGTTFSRTKNDKNKKGKDDYVNNITKSTYHQDFMKKIVD